MFLNNADLYFKDGKKSIDYVLVTNRAIASSNLKIYWLETYVQNLQRFGFEYERHTFLWDQNVEFILLHLEEEKLFEIYEAYQMEIMMNSENKYKNKEWKFTFLMNFLLKPDKTKPLYLRAPDIFDDNKPVTMTPAERIHALGLVLNRNVYGKKPYDYGLQNLIKTGVLEAAYPLHEGDYLWTDDGPLTRRQLLYEFWARPKRWHQMQPINLIANYLGIDYGFQHAWLEVYTAMLIIPGLSSVVMVMYGYFTISTWDHPEALYVCNSDILICPKCFSCRYFYLNDTCYFEQQSHVLSNTATNLFAIFISIWSTFVYSLWNRIENMNQLKWNVKFLENDLTMRPTYKHTAYYREERDGRLEPYNPLYSLLVHNIFSSIVVLGLVGFTVWVQIYIRNFRKFLTLMLESSEGSAYLSSSRKEDITAQFMSAVVTALFTMIYQSLYYKISYKVTELENPRTEREFIASYCHKCYIIDNFNFYVSLFFSGVIKLPVHPSAGYTSTLFEVLYESCLTLDCVLEIVILQFTLWFVRNVWHIFARLIIPWMGVYWKRRRYMKRYVGFARLKNLTQWERDFLLCSPDSLDVVHVMLNELVEYGFVSYFVSVFPLAPLCAFIANVINIRVEAYKAMILNRRVQSIKIDKMVNWSFLLKCTTYIGILTNAVCICFIGNFVKISLTRLGYHAHVYETSDNVLYEFKKINTSHVVSFYNFTVKEDYCYYENVSPNDVLHYQMGLSYKFVFLVFIFHVVFLIKGFASFIIPSIPHSVLEDAANRQKEKRKKKIQKLEETVLLERKKEVRKRFNLKKRD